MNVFERGRNRIYLIDVARLGRQMTLEPRDALLRMFQGRPSDVVFVNAFLNRKEFQRLVRAAPWGTVAWFAEEPDHMIHFNGDRFSAKAGQRAIQITAQDAITDRHRN